MKRGLALSGGGEKGAYQVGALKALYEHDRKYDVLAGVSAGALNAAHQAMYRRGDEPVAWQALEDLHLEIATRDVYRRWRPFGKLHGLWKAALFNSHPLYELINDTLSVNAIHASGKQLRIGATSLSTGEYRTFTENDVPLGDLVYASAAYPVAFSPIEVRGQWWADGGVRSVTPIGACIEAGCTHVDVVMLSPPKSAPRFDSSPNAIDVALRSLELQGDQIVADDLAKAKLWNRVLAAGGDGGGKRHIEFTVIRPGKALPTKLLRFTTTQAAQLIGMGYSDAVAVLEAV